MKKNLLLIAFIVIVVLTFFGCQVEEEPVIQDDPIDKSEDKELDNEKNKKHNDFTLILKDDSSLSVSVMDWDDKIDLENILGEPLDENNELIGEGGDTFQGSKIKTLKYDGLELQLMCPKGNDSYYVMTMTVYKGNYVTPKEIQVGDKLTKILNAYPTARKMEVFEKDNPVEVYRAINEGFRYIDFYITQGNVSKILLGIELQ